MDQNAQIACVAAVVGAGLIGFALFATTGIEIAKPQMRSSPLPGDPNRVDKPTPVVFGSVEPVAEVMKRLALPDAPPLDSDPYRYFDPKKAIAHFRFKDVDGDAEYDDTALDFASWAEARLPWSYVSGPAETTLGKALKDIDAERGKRGCWAGYVGEIKAAGGAFKGGLVAPDGKVVRFLAVHETGNVEQGSTPRFCGIVTGTIKFANAEGTTTDAVQAVGMFDLPANKKYEIEKPADFEWTKRVPKESL